MGGRDSEVVLRDPTAPNGTYAPVEPCLGSCMSMPHGGDLPEFIQWLKNGGVYKKQSGEDNLQYAFRLLQLMAKALKYSASPAAVEASYGPHSQGVCSMVKHGACECGGHTSIFVAACIHAKVPVRVVVIRFT